MFNRNLSSAINHLPDYQITRLLDLFGWNDADDPAHGAVVLELHAAGDLREDRVVFPDARVEPGAEPATPLPDDDRAARDEIAVVRLGAEPLRDRVAAVACASLTV